jgi:hypothetical protein
MHEEKLSSPRPGRTFLCVVTASGLPPALEERNMVTSQMPVFGRILSRILLVTTTLIAPLSSCSNQDPAFVENTYGGAARVNTAEASEIDTSASMDSTAADQNSGSDQGVEGQGEGQGQGDELGSSGDGGMDEELATSDRENESLLNLEPVSMTYKQVTNSLVDILWVIDSSGSMKEEQDYLGANFNSFIKGLTTSNLNFQTAITSTDVCGSSQPKNLAEVVCPGESLHQSAQHLRGSFVGESDRKVLKRDDSDLVAKFNLYTSIGINGSGFEHGLKAANLAVEKVISGANENLIRNESFLAVIVVSDEEDDGIGLGMKDAYSGKNFVELGMTKFRYTDKDLSSYLKTVKGEGKFSVSAITGTRLKSGKLCSSAHSQPKEEGTQYINAANATGGIVQSICDSDWDQSLFKLGRDIEAQISQISLERTPAAGSIKVFVDNVLMTKWTYSEGTRVIKFLPDAIPKDGATIRIEFLAGPAA